MFRCKAGGKQRAAWKIGFGILCMAAAIGISGCAKKTVTQEGARAVEKEYSKGQVMVIAATERNRYQNIYTDRLWTARADSGGVTFEEKLKGQIEQFLTELAVINLMADEEKVELTVRRRIP